MSPDEESRLLSELEPLIRWAVWRKVRVDPLPGGGYSAGNWTFETRSAILHEARIGAWKGVRKWIEKGRTAAALTTFVVNGVRWRFMRKRYERVAAHGVVVGSLSGARPEAATYTPEPGDTQAQLAGAIAASFARARRYWSVPAASRHLRVLEMTDLEGETLTQAAKVAGVSIARARQMRLKAFWHIWRDKRLEAAYRDEPVPLAYREPGPTPGALPGSGPRG